MDSENSEKLISSILIFVELELAELLFKTSENRPLNASTCLHCFNNALSFNLLIPEIQILLKQN
jgi:hypothetical protein